MLPTIARSPIRTSINIGSKLMLVAAVWVYQKRFSVRFPMHIQRVSILQEVTGSAHSPYHPAAQ